MTIDQFLDQMMEEAARRFRNADFLFCSLSQDGDESVVDTRTTMTSEDAVNLVERIFEDDDGGVIVDELVTLSGRLH